MFQLDSRDSEFEAYHYYLRLLRKKLTHGNLPTQTEKEIRKLIVSYELCRIDDDEFVEMANKLISRIEIKPKEDTDIPEQRFEELISDATSDPYDVRAEDWEYWLDTQKTARTNKHDSDSLESTYHRNGIKRDKTEFWGRPMTRKRLNRRLTKAKLQKHQQRHQPQM